MVQVLQLKKNLAEYKERYAGMQKKHEEHQAAFNKRAKDQLQTSNKELSQKVWIT